MAVQDNILLRVSGVSKKYCRSLRRSMWYGMIDTASATLGISQRRSLRRDEFWALKDVSFEMERAQVLGICGPNGSGKTTLMRIIAGILPLDEGSVEVNGRVSVVFATTLGLHPHYSGRENIRLMAAMHGMRSDEIERKAEEIIAFAELESVIDRPFGTYSSGMKSRLGYAVAFSSDPDLFVCDEAIAVGDMAFKEKCYEHIRSMPAKRKSVIFVSSAISRIKKVATQILILDKGHLVLHANDVSSGINYYKEQLLGRTAQTSGRHKSGGRKGTALDLVSLHIPRTAGTSFRHLLQGIYRPAEVARLDISKKGLVQLNGRHYYERTLPKHVKVVHGHFSIPDLYGKFKIETQPRTIAWLRQPVHRLVSLYHYYQSILEHEAPEDVPRLVRRLMKGNILEFSGDIAVRNQYRWHLGDWALSELDFVGVVEHLEDDLKRLSQIMGWPVAPMEHVNAVKSYNNPDEDIQKQIAELNLDDMELYRQALMTRAEAVKMRQV